MAESSEDQKQFLYQQRYNQYNRMHVDEILPGLFICKYAHYYIAGKPAALQPV